MIWIVDTTMFAYRMCLLFGSRLKLPLCLLQYLSFKSKIEGKCFCLLVISFFLVFASFGNQRDCYLWYPWVPAFLPPACIRKREKVCVCVSVCVCVCVSVCVSMHFIGRDWHSSKEGPKRGKSKRLQYFSHSPFMYACLSALLFLHAVPQKDINSCSIKLPTHHWPTSKVFRWEIYGANFLQLFAINIFVACIVGCRSDPIIIKVRFPEWSSLGLLTVWLFYLFSEQGFSIPCSSWSQTSW